MKNYYQIILADDHEILCQGLKSLIEKDPSLRVVAQAKNGLELISALKSFKTDIVILDLSMPEMDGLTALEGIKNKFSKVKVLVLTTQKDREHFKHAMARGACGYILKDDAFDQLLIAVKTVLKGKKFVSPSIAALLTDQYLRSLDPVEGSSLEILTRREKDVLKLVAAGCPNKQIALRLKISIRTVETHRANLSRKLGVNNTANLVRYAMQKGLV